MRSITIKDIAKKLNLSVSTVSRALNNHPDIKKETKEEVQKMANELNYQPSLVARNFRMSTTHTIGVVVPDLVTHFFSATISGIQNEANARGYNIMICQSNESYDTEVKNVNTLVSSRVDGLLLSLSKETTNYEHIINLFNQELPIVLFDRVFDSINVSRVTVDEHEGAYKATSHLIEMGYKRIAHISGPERLSISSERLQGYRDALLNHNIEVKNDYIIHSNLSQSDITGITKRLLSLPEPPDAIFAINDPTATYIMGVLKEMGINIPNEMGLVGFNNEPISALIEPALSTVEQPAYQIGVLAARQLITQLDNPQEYIPQKIVLKTKFIERNSSMRKEIKA